MKATELMIGDWVKPKNSAWPFKVSGISMEGVTKESSNYYKCDEIEPISLTAEILEKNGFEKVLDNNKIPTYRIKWPPNSNYYFTILTGVDCYWNFDGYAMAVGAVQGKIDYVHQLQHALRICGIKKEIII